MLNAGALTWTVRKLSLNKCLEALFRQGTLNINVHRSIGCSFKIDLGVCHWEEERVIYDILFSNRHLADLNRTCLIFLLLKACKELV